MITMFYALNIYTQGTEQNAGTMRPTKGHLVFSSVVALFRFALTVLLLRNQHGLQTAKNLCTTHPHVAMQTNEDIQTTICHILQFNTCNENSSVHQNQKAKETPTIGLPICFFALDVL